MERTVSTTMRCWLCRDVRNITHRRPSVVRATARAHKRGRRFPNPSGCRRDEAASFLQGLDAVEDHLALPGPWLRMGQPTSGEVLDRHGEQRLSSAQKASSTQAAPPLELDGAAAWGPRHVGPAGSRCRRGGVPPAVAGGGGCGGLWGLTRVRATGAYPQGSKAEGGGSSASDEGSVAMVVGGTIGSDHSHPLCLLSPCVFTGAPCWNVPGR